MPLSENRVLLTIVVICALSLALGMYLAAWWSAWRRRLSAFLGSWLAGSALVVAAGYSPFLLGIRFGSNDAHVGPFETVATLFLVITVMGAFVPLAVISGAALILGGLIFMISKAAK